MNYYYNDGAQGSSETRPEFIVTFPRIKALYLRFKRRVTIVLDLAGPKRHDGQRPRGYRRRHSAAGVGSLLAGRDNA